MCDEIEIVQGNASKFDPGSVTTGRCDSTGANFKRANIPLL